MGGSSEARSGLGIECVAKFYINKNIIMKNYLALGTITLLLGCAPSSEERAAKEKSVMDISAADGFASSSAAVESGKDTTRKFIRTADLRFKVKNVIKATYAIEDIIRHFDGFVTYTNLNSSINYTTQIAVSADSSVEMTYYTVENSMTLRVPNVKLDTTLKTIAAHIDFLDSRVIKADDVALQLLANQMTQSRVGKHEERLINAIDNRGKKLNETTNAEENLLNKQEQADHAKISNLSLKDQINFSTVTLSIYQRQSVKVELIPREKKMDEYKQGFGTQFLGSLKYGWEMLETFIIAIAKIWWLIVLGFLCYFIIKKITNRVDKQK
jgi:hypothetical protein